MTEFFETYVLAMMNELLDTGRAPTFSEFQNTPYWEALREQLPLSQKRKLIQIWDDIYREMQRTAQSR